MILAVVITYNPDKILLQKNIDSFIDYVDKVLIWNNTPNDIRNESCKIYADDHKVIYKGAGDNVGIPKALNYAWKYAFNKGYDYLLTMDQDSVWYDFESYRDAVFKKNKDELCICGPYALENINSKPSNNGFVINRWQITSGMLIKTELLDAIGGYNEFFKVDCVDIEFCLRAKHKGYYSYYCSNGFLRQQYGLPFTVGFCGRTISYVYYSPFRVEGIFEGHLLLYRKYKESSLISDIKKNYLRNSIKALILGKNVPRIALFKAMALGFIKGIFLPLKNINIQTIIK